MEVDVKLDSSCERHAGDGGVVVKEADIAPAGEEFAQGIALPEAEFKRK